MACRVVELFRLAAIEGDSGSGALTGDPATLLVFNPLAAVIWIRFGNGTPSSSSYDLACPGEAMLAWPIDGGTGNITAVVDYPGAVPAGDVGQEAIIRASEATLSAFVGPLNA
jgi:hypothetical protein